MTTPTDDLWYQDAIIYQVHVRAFLDANNDGIGDFAGLTQKLDYIQDLGVNTIWLLPFCPSPGKDDGYDIANYLDIHPQYGTLDDFREFIRESHRRGLKVITELVVNHTSDQHPWFQSARRAPPGTVQRDYYVWSSDPNRYSGTRIIFTDTESSNWAWDPLAQSYYWHRFFSHQPDLNYENPEVRRAVIDVLRFWLDLGVDGLRLDAIPYLCEREGTNNENLPETHAVIKEIRAAIDRHYQDRMLLGEANQWPEDVRDYFGEGDECHMAFHFPLMPRMYMAIAQEDRHPIVEIMAQTPDIPPNCQWAIFLRNHDELTLEMVTSRERDYMYKMYAADPRARINLGIRRRLAPLMENDPDRIKLMNSLLLSMPGTPIVYYGDEIGMGDNFFLGDRNGVRTPMQWSLDRNAGFSRADPQQLYLPPIMDPVYGFQAVNVEAQMREPSSLLNWMKRMLRVRGASRAFGRGALKFIRPGNRKILVYIRELASTPQAPRATMPSEAQSPADAQTSGDETILCVANLSRSAQAVELDLSAYKGRVPVEMIGRTAFPPIGELPYLLTLPGYAFYWFRLVEGAEVPAWHEEKLPRDQLPFLVLFEGWKSLFREFVVPWRGTMADRVRRQLETEALPGYLAAQRWFAGKSAAIKEVSLVDFHEWTVGPDRWLLALFRIDDACYFLPMALAWEEGDESRMRALLPAAIARVRQQARTGVLGDAMTDELFCRAIVSAIGAQTELAWNKGKLHFSPTAAYADYTTPAIDGLQIKPLPAQGTNTTVRLGDALLLKAYRQLKSGVNPELEIGRYLTEKVRFKNCVPVLGAAEYSEADNPGDARQVCVTRATVALLQPFVTNQGDAWTYTLDYLTRFFQSVGMPATQPAPDVHGAYLPLIDTLAKRTAELHLALATPTDDPAFKPEPITLADVSTWIDRAHHEATATFELLQQHLDRLPAPTRAQATTLLAQRNKLQHHLLQTKSLRLEGLKTRYHGDYHLGQVLLQRNDFILIDFEGEPGRPLEERRAKHSPLRDVASMLRSFSYASAIAIRNYTSEHPRDSETLDPLAREWESQTRARFLQAYARTTGNRLYASFDSMQPLLDLFELEKALYELRYELNNRPDWVGIPLQGLLSTPPTMNR